MDVVRHCLYVTNLTRLKNGNSDNVKCQLLNLLGRFPANTMICPIYTDWKNLKCLPANPNNVWIPVTSTTTPDDLYPQESSSLQGNEEDNKYRENLCDLLHRIADNLPLAGSIVDIIVDFSEVSDLDDDILPVLHGVLKRYQLWLCASIFIIYVPDTGKDVNNPNNIDVLLEVWAVDCLPSLDQVTIPQNLAWKGNIILVDKQNCTDSCFSGFALETTQKSFPIKIMFNKNDDNSKKECLGDAYSCNNHLRLGSHMKILDIVDVHTIPHFAIRPQVFKLVLLNQNEKSHQILEYLSNCDQLAIIVAVSKYSADHMVASYKTSELNTVAWKEYILADFTQDIIYTSNSKDGELMLFVLVPQKHSYKPNSSDSSMEVDTPGHYCIDAYMMRSAAELDGEIFDLLHQSYCPPLINCSDVSFPALPVFNGKILSKVNTYLTKIQAMAVKNHLKDDLTDSLAVPSTQPRELFQLLANVQQKFLENLKSKLNHKDCFQPFDTLPSRCQLSELDLLNCAQWPEKRYIQQLESMKKTICRFRSFDSMSLSSPYVPLQDVVPTEIEEILSHFQDDGLATSFSLTPLLSQHNLRSYVFPALNDEYETCLMKWPHCREARFPGICYNKDNQCEKIQNRLNKLRDKFITADTSTTYSLQNCRSTSLQSTTNPRIVQNFKSKHSLRIKRNAVASLENRSMSDPKLQDSRNAKQKKLSHVMTRHMSAKELVETSPNATGEQFKNRSLVKSSKEPIQATDNELKKKKVSRSERHKQKLESIVKYVLKKEGLTEKDEIFSSCFQRLYKVTKLYVMDLPDSRKLGQEMRRLAENQVKHVVEIETHRQKSMRTKKTQKSDENGKVTA
ncbi:Hypothetical predicted protein [Octopus vulgaris]|nr:Hypothetical predicted protein [Octopus vulgaris]